MSSASRNVLAYCLQYDECIVQCIDIVKPSYFDKLESRIYKIISEFYRKYDKRISNRLFSEILESQNLDAEEQQEMEDIFEEVLEENIDASEFKYHLDELKKQYTSRVWEEAWRGGLDDEGAPTEGIGDLIEKNPRKAYEVFKSTVGVHMEEVENEQLSNCFTLAVAADKFLAAYKDRAENPEKAYGIRTGFDWLDQQTLGIHPGEMFLIGGRPGAGKSVFILNVGINAYKAGKNVLIVSIEMPHDLYQQRFYSCYCDLPHNAIRAGTLTKEQFRAMADAIEHIKQEEKTKNHYLHIADITSVSAFTVEAEVKKVTMRYGVKPDLLVVDYLGIMKSIDKSTSDWQAQLAIAEELRCLGRVKNIPVLSAVQLNRDKHKGKGTERIGRADGIGATCDVFLQIEEKAEEGDDDDGKKKLSLDLDDTVGIYIGKCRNGETDTSFQLYKKFANMTVKNKGVYKSKIDQAVESLNEIEMPIIIPDKQIPQENEEDQESKRKGDIITND